MNHQLRVHTFPKGKVLSLPGDSLQQMYLIDKGEVKVSKYSADGREVILEFIKPGEVFGEIALLEKVCGAMRRVVVKFVEQQHVRTLVLDDRRDVGRLGIARFEPCDQATVLVRIQGRVVGREADGGWLACRPKSVLAGS